MNWHPHLLESLASYRLAWWLIALTGFAITTWMATRAIRAARGRRLARATAWMLGAMLYAIAAYASGTFIFLSAPLGDQGTFAVLGSSTANFGSDADHTATSAEYAGGSINATSTGSLTATRKLILPLNAGEAKDVFNGTTGGQSITVGGATGSATSAIANGNQARVVTPDGVNYYAISGGAPGLTPVGTGFVVGGGSSLTYRTIAWSDVASSMAAISGPIAWATGNSPKLSGNAANFSSDANHTATSAEYNAFFLNAISGVSLTAQRDLILPLDTGSPVWLIRNATTGGQAIRVIGVSGTGFVIDNGSMAVCTTDATNVYCNKSSGATLPSITFSGDISAVTSGNAADAAVTSITGAGVNTWTDSGTRVVIHATQFVLADSTNYPITVTDMTCILSDSSTWVPCATVTPASDEGANFIFDGYCDDKSVDSGGVGIPNPTGDHVGFSLQFTHEWRDGGAMQFVANDGVAGPANQVNLTPLNVGGALDGGAINTTAMLARVGIVDAGPDAVAATQFQAQLMGPNAGVYHCSLVAKRVERKN